MAAAADVRSAFIQFITRPAKLQRLSLACALVILVAGLATAVFCPVLMKMAFTPTPHVDQWAILNDISAGEKWYSVAWLWKQHNEHRIPLLRLALYADLHFFGGHGVLLYVLMFVTLLAQWLMWSAFLRKAAGLSALVSLSIIGFFGFCFFCPNQYQNFYSAIQWTFIAEFFFASAAFIALAWFAGNLRPWTAVCLASAAAFLAEGSLASGVFTWPILCLESFAMPLRRRHRFVLAGIGAFAMTLYLYNYWQPPYHSNPLQTIQQPWPVLQYLITYIGFSLSAYFVQSGFAAVVVSAAAFAAVVFLIRRRETHVAGVAIAASMIFVWLTGGLMALGRLKLGIAQAEDSRYQTPVMLYWGCAFAALLIAAWLLRSWRDVLALNLVAIAAIFIPVGKLSPLIEIVQERADLVSLGGQSLDRGVVDPFNEPALLIPMWVIIPVTRYLHSHSIALGPNPPRISSSTLTHNLNPDCRGRLDTIWPVTRFDPGPREIRVNGWAINNQTDGPVDAVAILDDHGTVLAESSLHFRRKDVLKNNPGAWGRIGWHIYIPVTEPAEQVRAIAIVNDHACPLTKLIPINRISTETLHADPE